MVEFFSTINGLPPRQHLVHFRPPGRGWSYGNQTAVKPLLPFLKFWEEGLQGTNFRASYYLEKLEQVSKKKGSPFGAELTTGLGGKKSNGSQGY